LVLLAKLRTKGQWDALARYANADLNQEDTSALSKEVRNFEDLITRCMSWIEPGASKADLELCRDVRDGHSLEFLGAQYQGSVRDVLKWLSDPRKHRKLAGPAVEFLRSHGTDIEMEIRANSGFDPKTSPVLVFEELMDCGSVMSPVCRFILDQIERHDEGEEKLREVIPLATCERTDCGNFMIVERAGKRFCSNLCRALNKQSEMTPEQRAERMRKYRQGLKEMSRKPIRISKKGGKK
jgi:hypothetical protein